jgi:hypothetical protein
MTFEEFEKAEPNELRRVAKACFDSLGSMGGGGWDRKAAKLLEAQFYMMELDRRESADIARRDFRMELIVIALIGLELIVGIWGITLGVRENKEQAQAMERVVQGLDRVEKAANRAGNMDLIH